MLKEKNKALADQLKAMKREHEHFSTQMTENLDALRIVEDKARDLQREKQQLEALVSDKDDEIIRLIGIQQNIIDQLGYTHHEAILKNDENQSLKLEASRLTGELEIEKKSKESLEKSYEASKMLDEQLNTRRLYKDGGLGHKGKESTEKGIHTTERGESSKQAGNRNSIKRKKPICYYCGNQGHTANICQIRKGKQLNISKSNEYCYNCNKYGHTPNQCRTKSINNYQKAKFKVFCKKCNRYGYSTEKC